MQSGLTQAQVVNAYQQMARTEDGQIVISDLMSRFGFTRKAMYSPGDDTASLAFKEGQRSVLIHLGIMLDVDPQQVEEDDHDHTQY